MMNNSFFLVKNEKHTKIEIIFKFIFIKYLSNIFIRYLYLKMTDFGIGVGIGSAVAACFVYGVCKEFCCSKNSKCCCDDDDDDDDEECCKRNESCFNSKPTIIVQQIISVPEFIAEPPIAESSFVLEYGTNSLPTYCENSENNQINHDEDIHPPGYVLDANEDGEDAPEYYNTN